jgi:pyruvate/2-oxoglutarate dehydrogenase complex dihydrolipoamide dehydrogenase (E3) component
MGEPVPAGRERPAGAGAVEHPLLLPLDEHNLRHLANVRPRDHVNPGPKERYHLVVIGAGTAGLVTAAAGAALGAKVALVERQMMGGDCLNVGCVPSKAIIRAARAWHEAAIGSETFGAPRVAGPGDFSFAMRRMRRLRADLGHVDGVPRFRGLGVDVFLGEGRFTAPDLVEVGGARLRFRRAIIATGARAGLPPVPGLTEAGALTNETIFWLEELPARLAVIGAGPIGCEMAQAFARFGSRVTLLNRSDRVLPKEDRDAAAIVEAAMVRDGVDLQLGSKLLSVERDGAETTLRCERAGRRLSVAADRILVAAGRVPNVEGLGLESAGVLHDAKGVRVDDFLRTTNPKIYAIGDVSSRHQFTHAADAQARLVVANALFFGRGRASRLVMPWCTFTSPEIAHVGLYEQEAREAGLEVDTLTISLKELDRAVLDGANDGFVRVHLKKGSDRILGATLVAEHAGDMIGELALAITAKVGLGAIGATIHPYPTQGEVIRKAADAWRRAKLTPRVKRVFDLFFRILR